MDFSHEGFVLDVFEVGFTTLRARYVSTAVGPLVETLATVVLAAAFSETRVS